MSDLIGVIIVFLTSYAGVAAYRRWSERKGIFDLPNERSSHAEPTPRGGGLVIAAVYSVAVSALPIFFILVLSSVLYFTARENTKEMRRSE